MSAPTPRRRPSAARRFLAGLGIGVIGTTALLAGLTVGAVTAMSGLALPATTVEGISVGSLDRSGIIAALEPAAARVAATHVVVIGPDGLAVTVVAGDAGRRLDVDAIAAAAVPADPTGPVAMIARAADLLAARGRSVDSSVVVDRLAADALITALAAEVDRPATDARIDISSDGRVTVSPSEDGRFVDVVSSTEVLVVALADPRLGEGTPVALVVVPVAPAVATAALDPLVGAARAVAVTPVTLAGPDGYRTTIGVSRVRMWIRLATQADSTASSSGGELAPLVIAEAAGTRLVIDRGAIAAYLSRYADTVEQAPVDAGFLMGQAGELVGVVPGAPGRALDASATAERIGALLAARVGGMGAVEQPIDLVAGEVRPALDDATAAAVLPRMERVGTWTTRWVVGPSNGYGANILIPAGKIDGTVVAPGETFGFWDVVGVPTFADGYAMGGAIINGRSQHTGALAGGICAVSTTMFNAAARAGFEILTRGPHYYAIPRYPLGLDATVWREGKAVQDMRFRNDSAGPLYIRSVSSPGNVTFEIYAVPDGRTTTFSEPVVTNVNPAIDTSYYTSALARGRSVREEDPYTGMDVSVVRTVTAADGTVLHLDTFFSAYHRVDGIVAIGR